MGAKNIIEQLQQAIEADGRSLAAIGKECGIDRSVLSRFVAGERGMNLESAAKLAEMYNLELRKAKKGR